MKSQAEVGPVPKHVGMGDNNRVPGIANAFKVMLKVIGWQFRYQPGKKTRVDNDSFMRYWKTDTKAMDEPNTRRNGWSNVQILESDSIRPSLLYVKKQENYYRRTLFHLLKGITTIENEARSIYYLKTMGIKIPNVVFWGIRRERRKEQAVLVTEHLQGYLPLTELLEDWESNHLKTEDRRRIILALARELRKMHDAHIVHNSLYPKHIFVNPKKAEFSFIDLEKAKIRWTRMACSVRDLDSLNRHTFGVSRTDKLRFLMEYCNTSKRTPEVTRLWKILSQRYKEKIQDT